MNSQYSAVCAPRKASRIAQKPGAFHSFRYAATSIPKKTPLTNKASRSVELSGIRKWGNLNASTDDTATRLTPIIVPQSNAVRSVFILNEEILHPPRPRKVTMLCVYRRAGSIMQKHKHNDSHHPAGEQEFRINFQSHRFARVSLFNCRWVFLRTVGP